MKVYRVTFVGQGVIENESKLKELLAERIARLLEEKPSVAFLVARENHFDTVADAATRLARSRCGNHHSTLSLSLPHTIDAVDLCQNYDAVVYSVPMEPDPNRTVQSNRRAMIEQSDLVLGYVREDCGEAYHALEYAKKRGKSVQNLAELLPDGELDLLSLLPPPKSFISS